MAMRRLILWGVVLGLFSLGCWLSYQWGESNTRAEMAEARAQAVADARAEAEAEYAKALKRQRVRARAHVARIEKLQESLREQTRRAERYAESDAGQQQCFGEPGVEEWNAY